MYGASSHAGSVPSKHADCERGDCHRDSGNKGSAFCQRMLGRGRRASGPFIRFRSAAVDCLLWFGNANVPGVTGAARRQIAHRRGVVAGIAPLVARHPAAVDAEGAYVAVQLARGGIPLTVAFVRGLAVALAGRGVAARVEDAGEHVARSLTRGEIGLFQGGGHGSLFATRDVGAVFAGIDHRLQTVLSENQLVVAIAHLGGTTFGTGGVIPGQQAILAETARRGRRGWKTDLALGTGGAVRYRSCEHAKIDGCCIEVVFGTISFVIGQRRGDALLGRLLLFGIVDELAGALCPAPTDGGRSEPRSFRESSATGMLAHMRRVSSFSRYREVVHVVAGSSVAVRRTGSGALER